MSLENMRLLWLVVVIAPSTTFAQCEIEGELVLWQMAFCMSMYETDDPGNTGVDWCFNNLSKNFLLGGENECEVKEQLATSLCLSSMSHEPDIGSVSDCLVSKKYVPSLVENGGI
ncbi:hypothetical protein ACN5W3_004497 [Vibrio parahaemolyticus]